MHNKIRTTATRQMIMMFELSTGTVILGIQDGSLVVGSLVNASVTDLLVDIMVTIANVLMNVTFVITPVDVNVQVDIALSISPMYFTVTGNDDNIGYSWLM